MKKLLIIALLSVCSLSMYAYVPLVREGVEWGYYKIITRIECSFDPERNWTYRLQFKGETEFDGLVYKNLYQYRTETLDTETTAPRFYMREEAGKVYVRYPADYSPYEWQDVICRYRNPYDGQMCTEQDILIYDFNLKVGEELYVGDWNEWVFKVFSIEHQTIDHQSRKVFNYNKDREEPNFLVEGIGPIGKWSYGFIPIPWEDTKTDGNNNYDVLLYERKVDTGEIVYKSPYFDEYAQYDPTVTPDGIEAPAVARPLEVTVDGRTLTFPALGAAERVNVTTLDGRTLYTGTPARVDLPAPGIYLISTPTAHAKIAVK